MQIRLLILGLLVSCSGCADETPKPFARRTPGFQVTASGEPNFQLPDIDYWTNEHFVNHGVRDVTAPNMLLSHWCLDNPPEEKPLLPETQLALDDDSAIAINLHDVRLTPELQSEIAGLQTLEWLNISLGANATDLDWLGDIENLRGLSLDHANLEGANFEFLGRINGLQYLTLYSSEFTDADFATIPELEQLERLVLSGLHVNDKCLQHLADLRLPKLRSLSLEHASVTDDGLVGLCEAYNLEYLNLYRTGGVSSESVPALGRMQNLQVLGVGATGISPDYTRTNAVAELQRLLPQCRVDHGD